MLRHFSLPSLLSCESFVQKREHLGHIELHILQVEIFLVVFLHLQQVVKLEVELEKPACATCQVVSIKQLGWEIR